MKIKVCGMRDAENIRALDEKRLIDWMGFIFYPQSPRYVHEKPTYLPKNCRRVGVFVNDEIFSQNWNGDMFSNGLNIL